jgi:hypothetical protein
MARRRKIDEDIGSPEDGEDGTTDHVVERFFAQQERGSHDLPRKPRPAARGRKPPRPDGSSSPGPDEAAP